MLLTLTTALLFAAPPTVQDQSAMQATFARFFRAINTCNSAAARRETTEGYSRQVVGLPAALLDRLAGTSCPQPADASEFAVLARSLTLINPDTAWADGFFRTTQVASQRAGRVYVLFVRQANTWKIGAVRLAPVPLEPPYHAIPSGASPSKPHSYGWETIDATHVVDLLGTPVAAGWTLDGGTFQSLRGAYRDIRTTNTYRNFELRFEWKVSQAANSGIKYRLFYFFDDPDKGSATTGYEYQIVDNEGDPGAKRNAVERAASLYNQLAAQVPPRPAGEWNQGAIIVRGNHVEHWLNDRKALELECESAPLEGPIVFQHHGGGAWLRNIRIRRLD
ncbi:MAG: DUF1080 domain-containing protein [Bryobacterales bacterium]|nr:DUF1080 domain-containing protein [Bryobacterales bacterium]